MFETMAAFNMVEHIWGFAFEPPIGSMGTSQDLIDDPHLARTGFWDVVADAIEGLLRFPGNPLAMSASPPSLRRLPPQLGEHTAEVLAEFGIYDRLVRAVRETTPQG